jgi:hypothetical protein
MELPKLHSCFKVGLLSGLIFLTGAGCTQTTRSNSIRSATTSVNSTNVAAGTNSSTKTINEPAIPQKSTQTLEFYLQKIGQSETVSKTEFKKYKSLKKSFSIDFGDLQTVFLSHTITFVSNPTWNDNKKHTFFMEVVGEGNEDYYGPFNDTVSSLFKQAKAKIGQKIGAEDIIAVFEPQKE